MQDVAPPLSEAEREAYINRCPKAQQPAFRGWLEGTHHLDGEPREPEPSVSRYEQAGVAIGHGLGRIGLAWRALRPGVEWKVAR